MDDVPCPNEDVASSGINDEVLQPATARALWGAVYGGQVCAHGRMQTEAVPDKEQQGVD